MKLSEMKQLLTERQIQLTKSLGQNFLHDANQLRRIVELGEVGKEDRILEIGPGLGPLTDWLLERASFVRAIEKDARLVTILRERFSAELTPSPETGGRLELIEDDALDYLKRGIHDWTGWKLVSNLPYSVGSPILVELAQAKSGPECMVATLQAEVAARLMASCGDPDYGVLTLLVQLDYEPLQCFKIPASCFFPPPDVDSACVALRRRSEPRLKPEERDTFVSIVKRSFSQRRKMMVKLLKTDWPAEVLNDVFSRNGLDLKVRAERVSLEQFVEITRTLHERRDL